MSNLTRFLKKNKVLKENGTYAPTKSLVDETGEPLKFEFRHIGAKEDNEIRDNCTFDVPVTGKPNLFRPKLNTTKYIHNLIVASTVVPDLDNAELQDSYGVKTPADLLYALVDDPGEYQELGLWVQNFQGFTESMEEKTEQAKN